MTSQSHSLQSSLLSLAVYWFLLPLPLPPLLLLLFFFLYGFSLYSRQAPSSTLTYLDIFKTSRQTAITEGLGVIDSLAVQISQTLNATTHIDIITRIETHTFNNKLLAFSSLHPRVSPTKIMVVRKFLKNKRKDIDTTEEQPRVVSNRPRNERSIMIDKGSLGKLHMTSVTV